MCVFLCVIIVIVGASPSLLVTLLPLQRQRMQTNKLQYSDAGDVWVASLLLTVCSDWMTTMTTMTTTGGMGRRHVNRILLFSTKQKYVIIIQNTDGITIKKKKREIHGWKENNKNEIHESTEEKKAHKKELIITMLDAGAVVSVVCAATARCVYVKCNYLLFCAFMYGLFMFALQWLLYMYLYT